ncbi:hypothetical protein B0H63DRAFT_370929, partial [Podospora didyma]
ISIDLLPLELLNHIFSYLDTESPSGSRLHDQPNANMFASPDEQTLKNVSLVNKRWRATSMPILFRHILWNISRLEPLFTAPIKNIPLLRFLWNNGLTRYVDTLTIGARNRYAMSIHSNYSCANVTIDRGFFGNYATNYNEVWAMLFGLMDPRTFTILAAPHILTRTISRMLFLGDAWSFNWGLLHMLSISRETRFRLAATSLEPEPPKTYDPSHWVPVCKCYSTSQTPCRLFTIRPWTSLLLNEKCCTHVYSS